MKKKWKWSITAYNLPDKSHDERTEICCKAGVNDIEANISFVHGLSDKEIKDVRKTYENNTVRISTFHLPMGKEDDISSFYETTRTSAVKLMQKTIMQAAILGSKTVILHPSSNPFSYRLEGFEKYLSRLEKSIAEIIPVAEENGITIALENMTAGTGCRFGSRPENFKIFSQRLDHKNIGFCLDTGHASLNLGPDGPSIFLDAMDGKLAAMHIQDNAGDRDSHLAPGRGLINWTKFFSNKALECYSKNACIESPPFSFGPNFTHTAEAWRKLVEDTDLLAEKSLIKH